MRSRSSTPGGLRIGRIARINVHLDWSVMVIFVLLVSSLGFGWLPNAHRDWSLVTVWITALAAGVLFFASVLAHELSHAIVGRALGVPVRRITLFIFGGLAEMESEPKRPMAELGMTIVGPITSLVIGVAATTIGVLLAGDGLQAIAPDDPETALRSAGPVASLFLWLGPINIILGIFNLIPGFPLDGGRVLRSILWAATGSLEKATRWATSIGRGFGWALMGVGVLMAFGFYFPILGGGLIGGLWMLMIGWFLSNAARASYEQLILKDILSDVPVTALMKRDVITVSSEIPVSLFVESHVMRYDQRCFPVTSGESMVGLVCLEDIRKVPREEWGSVSVKDVMTPSAELATVTTEENAHEALETLGKRHVEQLPVVKDGALLGLIRREDIMRWLALHRDAPAGA